MTIQKLNIYKIDVPWGKIRKHTFLDENSIRFEEVAVANDARFAALCDFYATHIEIIPIIGYCYMIRHGSLWQSINKNTLEIRFSVCMGIYQFMMRHKNEDTAIIYKYKGFHFLSQLAPVSKTAFLKNYILYGLYLHSIRVFLLDIPLFFLRYGIKKLKKTSNSIARFFLIKCKDAIDFSSNLSLRSPLQTHPK